MCKSGTNFRETSACSDDERRKHPVTCVGSPHLLSMQRILLLHAMPYKNPERRREYLRKWLCEHPEKVKAYRDTQDSALVELRSSAPSPPPPQHASPKKRQTSETSHAAAESISSTHKIGIIYLITCLETTGMFKSVPQKKGALNAAKQSSVQSCGRLSENQDCFIRPTLHSCFVVFGAVLQSSVLVQPVSQAPAVASLSERNHCVASNE